MTLTEFVRFLTATSNFGIGGEAQEVLTETRMEVLEWYHSRTKMARAVEEGKMSHKAFKKFLQQDAWSVYCGDGWNVPLDHYLQERLG